MAIVGSAADALGLPRSYGYLSSDTDHAAQIQLYDRHRQQQFQTLLQPQNTSPSSHIEGDHEAQQQSISSPPQADPPARINDQSHISIDAFGAPTLACANAIADKSASSNDRITRPASGDGIPAMPQESGMNQSASAQGSLTQFGAESMRKLEEQLSKLNPFAIEFVPSSSQRPDNISSTEEPKKKPSSSQARRKFNDRRGKAQREESIRRTVYVSDIDQQVTEECLAALFFHCGHVVDCRMCGDPNSVLRFAFVEFMNEEAAREALGLAGTMLGYYPVRVLPSKTAIVPVNPNFLPHSEDEREMCARTIYCTNIDKKVSQANVKSFFERLCGEVACLRLLGDYRHSTRIAFVEFVRAECAMLALICSGAILGSLPLRISPSKTPVRSRSPRHL